MYFQTGQVIFVPEWPKMEFVSVFFFFFFMSATFWITKTLYVMVAF
jgi:hypothetical protein